MLRRTGIFAVSALVTMTILAVGVQGVQQLMTPAESLRADIVTLDTLKSFGKLERPAVQFLHDKHTEAVAKNNQDCKVCHLFDEQKGQQSLLYKRLENKSKKAVMEVYHTDCVSCHRETTASNQPSGPVTCGGCHLVNVSIDSSHLPIGMDKSLHYRHSKAMDKKCETCHHVFDETTKKLVYAKGKEGTCRYCHGETKVENRISMQTASHLACITCHQKQLVESKDAGPVNCSGCHDPKEQKLIEVVKNVPRMKANQPDVVFVKNQRKPAAVTATVPATRMDRVPFSHKLHEQSNNTCRVCHHADLTACSECHTSIGSDKGKHITLAQAMHQINSEQSCVGCHTIRQEQPQCAGCHASIELRAKNNTATCQVCHVNPPTDDASGFAALDEKQQAKMLLESRRSAASMIALADVPDKVTIKNISDQYEAAEMPHRKIIQSLVKGMREDDLAAYFHREDGTLCQGCHHNSPATNKPPQCASCHGQPFDARNPTRPGLMAAYHQQCMECHSAMGLKKPIATDCLACHKKK